MRILQVAPFFLPYRGGQERYVYFLSRELVRKGLQVTVLTSNYPKSPRYEHLDGIEIVRHTCIARPLRNPIAPGLLIPSKRFREYNLIHSHNEHSFASNAAAVMKQILGIPSVITSHGHLVFGSPAADLFRKIYWRSLGKLTLRMADRITVATFSEKQRLISKLGIRPSDIDLVPVGVDLPLWDSFSDEEPLRFFNKYGLRDRKVILVATQLIKRKGIQYLIQAMPEVLQTHSNAVCVIAGTGDYELPLQELVRKVHLNESVIFTGLLNDRELSQAYMAADVFVLPSLGEGQPTCIMEAWAFSKPVIATRIDGVIDYFDNIAILVEPGDASALAKEIIGILSNPDQAKRMGLDGRRLVESDFSWDKVAECMIQTYEQTLSMRAGTQDDRWSL